MLSVLFSPLFLLLSIKPKWKWRFHWFAISGQLIHSCPWKKVKVGADVCILFFENWFKATVPFESVIKWIMLECIIYFSFFFYLTGDFSFFFLNKNKREKSTPILFLLWHGCKLDNVAIVAFRSTMSSHDHVDFMVTRDGLFRLQSPRPFQCVSASLFVEPTLSDPNSIIHQLTFWLTCQTDILK